MKFYNTTTNNKVMLCHCSEMVLEANNILYAVSHVGTKLALCCVYLSSRALSFTHKLAYDISLDSQCGSWTDLGF